MGLLTAPIMSNFPKCCTFVHPLYGRLNHSWLFDHRPWATSMDDFIIVQPWTTPLDDHIIVQGTWLVINHILVQITFLSLLGWFLIQSALLNMDDPYGRIGDELISHHPISCPFVQIVVQDIDVI